MRAAGNLAGVEFIAPPMYHYAGQQWEEIISESGYFFTKSAMRFFSCRIAWDSLTRITQELYGFITSEQHNPPPGPWDMASGPRLYTVRGWAKESGVIELSEFQQFATLKQARHYLLNAGFHHSPAYLAQIEKEGARFEAWREAQSA